MNQNDKLNSLLSEEYLYFKASLYTNTLLNNQYYVLLYKHSEDVLLDATVKSQAQLSKELNLSQPKLSTILNMLRAYSEYSIVA